MKKTKKILLRIFSVCCIIGAFGGLIILGINFHMKKSVESNILTSEEAAELDDVDCILVLGCGIKEDGNPSHMLRDRLTRSVELYELEVASKLLMSGDHGREDYNEVAVMKEFALDKGIASEDIFMDHAGFSTYESMYRAKEIFGARKIVVVTQEYHMYRALYVAKELGIEAYGVSSDYNTYRGQVVRDVREMLARAKDFGAAIVKPQPTYLGEFISIKGSGDLTND